MGQQKRTIKTGVKSLDKAHKAAAACQLRSRGLTLAQVAAELGCDPTTARELIIYGIGLIPKENAEVLIQLTHLRYDKIRKKLWEVINDEKTTPTQQQAAFSNMIRLEERQAKFFGLDAPAKVQLTGEVGVGALGFDPDTAEPWEVIVLLRRSGEPIPTRLGQWLEAHPEAAEKVEAALRKLTGTPPGAEVLTSGEILADARAEEANKAREGGKGQT